MTIEIHDRDTVDGYNELLQSVLQNRYSTTPYETLYGNIAISYGINLQRVESLYHAMSELNLLPLPVYFDSPDLPYGGNVVAVYDFLDLINKNQSGINLQSVLDNRVNFYAASMDELIQAVPELSGKLYVPAGRFDLSATGSGGDDLTPSIALNQEASILTTPGLDFGSVLQDKFPMMTDQNLASASSSGGLLEDAVRTGEFWVGTVRGLADELRVVSGLLSLDRNSKEFVALLSLYSQIATYDALGEVITNPFTQDLMDALQAGNRPASWYQLRYQSLYNVDEYYFPEIAQRRYKESNYFGLYNEGAPGKEESKDVYRMYTQHRQSMRWYDNEYGGNESRRESLSPAYYALLGEYAQILDEFGKPIDRDHIYVSQTPAGPSQNTPALEPVKEDQSAHNLLIGSEGADRLLSGDSGDVLIGEERALAVRPVFCPHTLCNVSNPNHPGESHAGINHPAGEIGASLV